MVRTFRAFLEFCYIVRCNVHNAKTLQNLTDALERFHQYRAIFITTGVRTGFSLPRQHSMIHYFQLIRMFGAPNGLCSSITESKHIKAVKEPWRRSSKFNALGQMLCTNQRLDKLAAARIHFAKHGMLNSTCLSDALNSLNLANTNDSSNESDNGDVSASCHDNNPGAGAVSNDFHGNYPINEEKEDGEDDGAVPGPPAESHVDLARRIRLLPSL
jgi:hypothetical protein